MTNTIGPVVTFKYQIGLLAMFSIFLVFNSINSYKKDMELFKHVHRYGYKFYKMVINIIKSLTYIVPNPHTDISRL